MKFCTDVVIRGSKERDVILVTSTSLKDYEEQMDRRKLPHGIPTPTSWKAEHDQMEFIITSKIEDMVKTLDFDRAVLSVRRRIVAAYGLKGEIMDQDELMETLARIPPKRGKTR